MLPAHERLEADEALVRERDDRLIEHREPALIDGAAQIALDGNALVLLAAHLRREDLDAIGAGALRPVHGRLGFAQKLAGVRLALVRGGNADRAGEDDLLARDLDRRAQRAAQALGQHGELARVVLGGNEDRELIAADARERVARIERALQATGDREQQAVADDEAERAVHALELVEIEEEDRGPQARIAAPARQGHLETVDEQLAIGLAREAVVNRIVQQALARAPRIRDIADEADAAQRAAIGRRHGGAFELEPAIGAVGMANAEVEVHRAAGLVLDALEEQQQALAVGLMQVAQEIIHLAREIAGPEPERRLDERVHLDFVAARIPLPHTDARHLNGGRAELSVGWTVREGGLGDAEGELRDGKADQQRDEHEAGQQARDRNLARESPGQRRRRAEEPDEQQDPRRRDRQRAIEPAQAEVENDETADRADRTEREARDRRGKARVEDGGRHDDELAADPDQEEHPEEAVPQVPAQEREQEYDKACGDRGLRHRAVLGVVLGPHGK